MANTAFGHDATLTTPGSTTDTALVRWANTSGTSLNNTINILSDGSNITLNARGEVRFSDADSSHYIAFESPATVSTSYTMTLPADLPAADEVLTVTSYSGGAGVLEWAAAGGGAVSAVANGSDNRIATFSAATTLNGESALTFNGTTLTIGSDYDVSDANGLYKRTNGTLQLNSNSSMAFNIDSDSNQSGRSFWFYNNSVSQSGTQIMELAEDGNLNVMLGNVVIGTAGKGIDFSASTHSTTPSGETIMDNELFDDYEEGAWTARSQDSAGNSGSHASQVGRYTKIGNICYITCYTVNNGQGSMVSSNTIRIYQLPFTSENVTGQQSAFTVTSGQGWSITANTQVSGRILPNVTYIDIRLTDTTSGGGNMLVSEWTGSGGAVISGFYRTAT
jgi:hypothetical protein